MSRRPLPLLLAATTLALLACTAFAQRERDREGWNTSAGSVDVSGEVRFADQATPAPNVPVRLERFGGGVIEQMATDSRGRFRFANLPRGQYVVRVSSPCYFDAQQQVELTLIFRAYLPFDLKRDSTSPGCGAGEAAGVVDARVPAEAREEFEKGRSALADGKSDEGVERLQKAVRLYPDFFGAHLLLAKAHTEARRWDKAEAALRRAAEIDPRSATALISLGEVQRRRQKYAEAERSLLAGLKLDDESWQGHLALGRTYLDTGQVKKAAPHIGRALQLKPDLPEAHLLAGNILLKVGEPARALAEYEEYLRLAPSGDYAAPTRELVAKLRQSLAGKKDD